MQPNQDEFLEELYHEFFHELEIYAYSMLRDRDYAPCAVQEAFHTACQKIDEVMNSPNPRGWMKATVRNICLNMLKRRSRETQLVMSMEDMYTEPADPRQQIRDFEMIESCRKLVSPEEFARVKAVVLDHITYVELAEKHNITMWACYKRVERTLKKMQVAMRGK